ncbi:MAG: N-6 DNA methylase [Thermoanaerobaculia bacterium]
MITAGRLRHFRGEDGAVALFRELGYDVAPIDVDAEQWRRAGIEVSWNGDHRLRLLCRMRRFDLFLLAGPRPDGESIRRFLLSYHAYNIITKSSLIYTDHNEQTISIYDISAGSDLRRLDVDLLAPSAHALDRLNLLAASADSLSMPRIFDRALDRESVTRRFFERFRSAVADVAAALAAECPAEASEDIAAEALLILSRLLFLSFVQEKGWLNGERRFLADRLHAAVATGDEFFASVLVPLFFGCLNTPIAERDAASRALGRIPYLNGGLFERTSFELRHADVQLSNELMQQIVEELFERFDFSIDESDAAGSHVDPEMLGKVFESLMAEDERAASGSYYTPKAIVDVLTKRAIVEWLVDGDASIDIDRADNATAERLLNRLQDITVMDPACGSGAFLLSALSVIEDLTRILLTKCGAADPGGVLAPIAAEVGGATQTQIVKSDHLRQQIVERSLFGVDLKPEAVRLCELRLWLAIVATCDSEIEDVPPLPNCSRRRSTSMSRSCRFSP